MIGFPPHIFAVAIQEDLVVLDSGADRYVALPGAAAVTAADGIDVGLREARLAPGAVATLVEAGLLQDGAASWREPIPRPRAAHMPVLDRAIRPRAPDVARFVTAMATTGWMLRKGVGCRRLAHQRAQGDPRLSGDEEVLARLRDTRLIVPSPRRCLPASLIAARFLQGLGLDVEIVFGVRSHPFAAHCWIEAGGVVLDDDLDRVHAFMPIAVGRL